MTNDSFLYHAKRVPEYAEQRKMAARGWRKMRREKPELTRMLWRHVRAVEKKMSDDMVQSLFYGGNNP